MGSLAACIHCGLRVQLVSRRRPLPPAWSHLNGPELLQPADRTEEWFCEECQTDAPQCHGRPIVRADVRVVV